MQQNITRKHVLKLEYSRHITWLSVSHAPVTCEIYVGALSVTVTIIAILYSVTLHRLVTIAKKKNNDDDDDDNNNNNNNNTALWK
jgi:hypothetical protein